MFTFKHSFIATMCPFTKDIHTLTHSLTACQWSCVHPKGMFVCVCVFSALLPHTNSPVACSSRGKTHNNKSHTSSHTQSTLGTCLLLGCEECVCLSLSIRTKSEKHSSSVIWKTHDLQKHLRERQGKRDYCNTY